jgi:hypothetical protein
MREKKTLVIVVEKGEVAEEVGRVMITLCVGFGN